MLTINPSETIWTILGFLALLFLLKRFLYDPILRVMDERRARIDAGLNEEKRAQEALDAESRQLEALREEQLDVARRQLREEQQRDEQQRSAAIKDARMAALRLGEESKESARTLLAQTEQRLQEQGQELASVLAERLLNAGNTEEEK